MGYEYDDTIRDDNDARARYDGVDELKARRERLEREAARLSDRIEMLDNLPEEPVFEDGEPSVIYFGRTFSKRGAKRYDYAAIRAGDGLWYTTGPRTPKGYKWAEMIQWVLDNGAVQIWIATAYEEL